MVVITAHSNTHVYTSCVSVFVHIQSEFLEDENNELNEVNTRWICDKSNQTKSNPIQSNQIH